MGERGLRIETTKGKYGENDKIFLFTSTDKNDRPIEREAITIFKLCLLVNQLACNELQVKNGFKMRLVEKGEPLYLEEAIKEAIEMAKNGICWAESRNQEKVKEWAKRWNVKFEDITLPIQNGFSNSSRWLRSGKTM